MARLPKTNRPTRISLGKDGVAGRRNVCHISFTGSDLRAPAAASNTVLMVATALTTSGTTILSPVPNPDVPRNVTITLAGTTANIGAGNAVVTGTNTQGATITENIAVTAATGGTLSGSKAFATVTSVSYPATTGSGVTSSIGVGSKLGIGYYALTGMSVKIMKRTAAGVETLEDPSSSTLSATVLESNVVTPTSSLNNSDQFYAYVLNYNWALNPVNAFPNWGSK